METRTTKPEAVKVVIPVPKREGNEDDAKLPDTIEITVNCNDQEFADGPTSESFDTSEDKDNYVLDYKMYLPFQVSDLYLNKGVSPDDIPLYLTESTTSKTGYVIKLGAVARGASFCVSVPSAIRLYAEDEMRADLFRKSIIAGLEVLVNGKDQAETAEASH